MNRSATCLVFASYLACTNTALAEDRVYDSVCFNLVKNENFWTKTIKETVGSKEGRAILTAVCTYYTADPQHCAEAAEAAGAVHSEMTKNQGSDMWGHISVRPGYELCRAFVVDNDLSNTGDTTFTGTIHRDALYWYTSWQVGNGKRSWIDTQVILEQVPTGTLDNYECFKDSSVLWSIKGKSRFSSKDNEGKVPTIRESIVNLSPDSPKCIEHIN